MGANGRREAAAAACSLLPGLPDDVALDCLVRVPYRFHAGLRGVCRRWRDLLTSSSFYRQRRRSGAGESLVCLVQALAGGGGARGEGAEKSSEKQGGGAAPPLYGLSLYNATAGEWRRLPSAVPLFAQCAAVQASGKLVVLGGWDPASLDSVPDVYVVDLVTGSRRRGTPMSAARSFFACAVVGRLVYVAGGHDNQKNALRSAEAYDPETDEWRALPPMADERDECQGVAQGGRFWVVSGYGTDSQGRFDRAAECYDPATGRWAKEDDLWGDDDDDHHHPGAPSAPRSSCFVLPQPPDGEGRGGKLCHLDCSGQRRGVREYDPSERRWRAVGEAPPDGLRSGPCVAAIAGSDDLLVLGSDGEQRHGAWVMGGSSRKWRAVETPAAFRGFAFSGASVLL